MKTIEDVQNEYVQALSSLAPSGYSPVVALLDKDGRKKRRDASASYWEPLVGSVSVTFVKKEEAPTDPAPKVPTGLPPKAQEAVTTLSQPLADAIRALDAAEHKVSFVSIKWFRDQFLPSSGVSWATAPYAGQEVVAEAIQRGLFLTNKVPNPKAPAYPTTAIRLNRQLHEVQMILGTSPVTLKRAFRPVEITGEPLSATVIRERG